MQGLLVRHLVSPQRLNGRQAYGGMRLMQLKITFDLTDDAAGQTASGPRSPANRHPSNRTKYPLFENGRTMPFSQSCISAALTRRQFFVGYATLQFRLDQSLDHWFRSLERLRVGEMVAQEGMVQHCALALSRIVQLKDRSLYCRDSSWLLR